MKRNFGEAFFFKKKEILFAPQLLTGVRTGCRREMAGKLFWFLVVFSLSERLSSKKISDANF